MSPISIPAAQSRVSPSKGSEHEHQSQDYACRLNSGGQHRYCRSGTAAESYPTKPIRLIVPFPPGGPSDLMARMVAQKLTDSFEHAVVVDNRPGGGGTVCVETAVRANPDGYTMMLVTASYAANAALYKLPYDPITGVVPIALIGENGLLVALHPSVPIRSIEELIAYDQATLS
jgi:tripartite-type tricarboxylate transporter receptor subunit TctC